MHSMSDVPNDEALNDLESDSELDASEDLNYLEEDETFCQLSRPLRCNHQKFIKLSIVGEDACLDPVPAPCPHDDLKYYKIRERWWWRGRPNSLIHRSRFEDLCLYCDKFGIPEETKDIAHYLYGTFFKFGLQRTELESKAVISAATSVACDKQGFLITCEMERDGFNDAAKVFTSVITSFRVNFDTFMKQYSVWTSQNRAKKLLMWKMEDKREIPEFSQLLDHPESLRKCDYSFPRHYINAVDAPVQLW